MTGVSSWCPFFFFNDTATTEIYTLSLHDALPISQKTRARRELACKPDPIHWIGPHWLVTKAASMPIRSEEHTSELQSRPHLVCRLLLEKKKRHVQLGLNDIQEGNSWHGHTIRDDV